MDLSIPLKAASLVTSQHVLEFVCIILLKYDPPTLANHMGTGFSIGLQQVPDPVHFHLARQRGHITSTVANQRCEATATWAVLSHPEQTLWTVINKEWFVVDSKPYLADSSVLCTRVAKSRLLASG